ncbi:MAG: hypothetical protein ACI3VQ_00295 [Faecousia sp.]
MKGYTTLTREAVDVCNSDVRYMDEKYPIEQLSDRMLNQILNSPSINRIKKEEVRSILRQNYAALKRYEIIGPMASPFANDPAALVALAFIELYPQLNFCTQYVPYIEGKNGKPVCGATIFPADGSAPIINISVNVPVISVPEILAHELAHVAAGKSAGHGPKWKAAEESLFQKYKEIADYMISDGPSHVNNE